MAKLGAVTTLTLTAVMAAGLLTACGSSSGNSSGNSSRASTPTSGSSSPAGGFPGGNNTAVQQCLKAAGITVTPPAGRPSGFGTGAPPSGFPSLGAGQSLPAGQSPPAGFGGGFNNAKIRKALKACGISIPNGAPSAP